MQTTEKKSPQNITKQVYEFFLRSYMGVQLNVRTGNLETIYPRKELRGINHIGALLMEEANLNLKDYVIKRVLAYFREEWLSRTYDPVKEYLESEQVKSCDVKADWLKGKAEEWLGLETELDQVYLELTLVAAVARVFQPGCKKDEIWVLHGEQGIGKSRFCRALVPDGRFFTDSIEWEKFNQDTSRQLNRNWIVECPEISAIRKPEKMKRFLSTPVDEFRQWWTADFIVLPRRSIMIGTTNDYDLLTDKTGNRRFWVSSIPKGFQIPVEKVEEERDKMWCAAIDLYNHLCQTKEKWSLPSEFKSVQEDRQERFIPDDPVKFKVQQYLIDALNSHLSENQSRNSFFTSTHQKQ